MRLTGNKTHGDLAEIAIAEFINQYMYDFRSIHVGKEKPKSFRLEQITNRFTDQKSVGIPLTVLSYKSSKFRL
jgi:hypothetical protein